MLKKIPPIISPELMYMLMKMGHGDEILLADGNYPTESKGIPVVRADGLGIPELLEAILNFLPLDTFVEENIIFMDNGKEEKPVIWKEYRKIIKEKTKDSKIVIMERYDFYNRADNVFFIIATSERALYANIILKKGVV